MLKALKEEQMATQSGFSNLKLRGKVRHLTVAPLGSNKTGLSSAQSLSAYITYNPGPETISSDRTVVSNINAYGTPAVEAGAFIVKCTVRILDKKLSGVKLQLLG